MTSATRVTENDTIEAFHELAQTSLAQARSDGLIDQDYISSATPADLQVLGPALTLFFAALESTTSNPSVIVPATEKHHSFVLSVETCPTSLLPLFRMWSKVVPPLQALTLDQQHDVARLICDLEPISSPVSVTMIGLASDIEKLAISISQRKTFLERYTADLERGLAHSGSTTFRPPPIYNASSNDTSTSFNPAQDEKGRYQAHYEQQQQLNLQQHGLPLPPQIPQSNPSQWHTAAAPSGLQQQQQQQRQQQQETHDPAMQAVRETLYAALADVISSSNTLPELLRSDPARGYFAAVALAIVEAALNYVTPDGQRIRVFAFDNGGRAHTTTLGSEDAPPVIQSFVRELLKFNAVLRTFQERDDQRAIELAMQGQDDLGSLTLIESLKQELELGVDSSNSSESPHMVEMRTICNSVNRMAIAVTSLPGFQQRTGVFDVLRGVAAT